MATAGWDREKFRLGNWRGNNFLLEISMNNYTYQNPKAYCAKNKSVFSQPFLLMLAAALAWTSLLEAETHPPAQTVIIQETFNHKTDDIDGLSPTKGIESWKKWYDGVISSDGTQASLITSGSESQARATYPFDWAENTIYTLTVTFKVKPKEKDEGSWVGFGFGIGENADTDNLNMPWMLIWVPMQVSDDARSNGMVGAKEVGQTAIPASDLAAPITAKITWNTHTQDVNYFINNEAQLDWTQKVTPSDNGNGYRIFFAGMGYCNTVKVTNITLTSEPIKK